MTNSTEVTNGSSFIADSISIKTFLNTNTSSSTAMMA